MDLDIGERLARVAAETGDAIGIAAESQQRLAQADAGPVDGVEIGRLESAGERARACEGDGKAHALLVAEGRDVDGEIQNLARFMQGRHGFDGGDHAEIAVIAPGVAHGIDMGAEDQHRRVGRSSGIMADQRAGIVDLGRQTRLRHPAAHQDDRLAVLRREIEPRERARLARAGRERVEPLHHAAAGG